MMCISFYDNSVVLCRLLDHDDELPSDDDNDDGGGGGKCVV